MLRLCASHIAYRSEPCVCLDPSLDKNHGLEGEISCDPGCYEVVCRIVRLCVISASLIRSAEA
jgi:hypothetical protein